MSKTVADQFAETLAAAGVERAYGIVGDSLNVAQVIEGGTEAERYAEPLFELRI